MRGRGPGLSLEEKASLVVGWGSSRRLPGAAGETRPVRVPSIVTADGPSGLRVEPSGGRRWFATAFPVPTMLAATWNPEVVERVGRAIGEECRAYGVDVLLAPGVNMHRHPLCGRNFEYFSEDPLLSGEMAAAYVRGVQSVGVGATLKHFAANDQETNRTVIDTVVSERALREIYLKPFEIAVKKAKPWCVMSSYNKLNGKYSSQNEWLLTRVLREEWGFDGVVMTDWGAGDDSVEQVNAGNDLIMPGSDEAVEKLLEAARSGRLRLEALEASAERVLRLVRKSLTYRGYRPRGAPDLDGHARVAYEAASEGVVLLKNEGALPLGPGARVALFGTGQVETLKGGMGSGHTHPRYVVTVLEGLKSGGLLVDEELSSIYERYVREARGEEFLEKLYLDEVYADPLPQDIVSEGDAARFAERNDAAVVVLYRVSGEGWDRRPVRGDFYLTESEERLLRLVSREFRGRGKKVVVVLNVCGPIEVASWRDLVDAILVVWLPGQEAGRVVADVLAGRVNPSGKLPMTWPRDWTDVPAAKAPECYPGLPVEDPRRVVYCEGVYVGYRYYDTFGVEPAYEFGYGLSYTKFEYRGLRVALSRGALKVSFEVVNAGSRPGKEVAQVYVRAPRGRIDKPFQELKAFRKTRLLEPGEAERIKLRVSLRDLASFDEREKVWVVEPGEYEVRVGSSSRDIRLTEHFEVKQELRFAP
ncbi:glycoside hydrolase family 3 C-terminal domain-containing protein [Thermofilum pendens]|uniref:Glycoside hydrolase, family 3 domain protein n=1 Tax=Thermofilum pendens (strain DSM 2475 / Hrk 5) TaxID=368408 RepID=A1S0B1_THEPD|nr:glycoside hydrolase family 3 C-terminal domain-containing protein [Thermofilum pendens]ABL78891.1 glycoside hydrolase, family 3 domain protein [Thermofilum pendens Hrk 5]